MAIDLTTKVQSPDYRLPPEVYQLLAQAIQQKNQMYGQLGQSLGQFGSSAIQGVQQKQQENKRKDLLGKSGLSPEMQALAQAYPDAAGQIIPSFFKSQQKPKSYLADISWETATPQQQQMAKAMVEGNIRPSDLSFRDKGQVVALAEEYATKNNLPFQSYGGDVKRGMSENLAYGKIGQNALSLNTALGHVASAFDAYQNVANTNQQWLNVPLNKLRERTNDPKIVQLGVTLNAVQGELANVFKGSGGTDQEIGKWSNFLNENLTPLQAQGALQQVNDLLRSRLGAMQYQQQDVMGKSASQRNLLSPKGAATMQKVGGEKYKGRSIGDDPLGIR